MFGIGGFELFLILLFGFLIFGPDKLPAIAKTIGKAINKFRTSQAEMTETLKSGVFDKDSDEPFKNPLDVLDKAKAKTEQQSASPSAPAAAAATAAAAAAPKATTASADKATEDSAVDAASEQAETAPPKKESFSERKARFDRERAEARKAQEARGVAAAEATAKAAARRARERMETTKPAAPTISEAADGPTEKNSDTLVGAAANKALFGVESADAPTDKAKPADEASATSSDDHLAAAAAERASDASTEGRD